jgi:hypothetical protein
MGADGTASAYGAAGAGDGGALDAETLRHGPQYSRDTRKAVVAPGFAARQAWRGDRRRSTDSDAGSPQREW